MKKLYFLLIFFGLLFGQNKHSLAQTPGAPFKVFPCQTAQDVINIIDTVFLTGLKEMGLVSNITFKGKPGSVGRFINADTIMSGHGRGIVMSSGLVKDLEGPNTKGGTSGSTSGNGDPDLQKLSGKVIKDAAIIEFDFITMKDQVTFKYFFGSEEYNQYVNTQYNDSFGYFVSGDGIVGEFSNNAKNIATVPFSGDPVTINTINCGQETDYKKEPPGSGQNCGFYKWNDHFSNDAVNKRYIEFNGYTMVMSAIANSLTQCGSYHMKLAIGDAVDQTLDSGVFLEGQSFEVGEIVGELTSENTNVDGFVIDGCNEVELTFDIGEQMSATYYIPLTYTGAIGDVVKDDEIYAVDTIKIPNGSTTGSTIIKLATDNLVPSEKWLGITYSPNLCNPTEYRTDTVKLLDIPDVIPMPDFTIIDGPIGFLPDNDTLFVDCKDTIVCTANAEAGYPGYSFSWEYNSAAPAAPPATGYIQTTETTEDLTFKIPTLIGGKIKLSATDQCDQSVSDSVYYKVGAQYCTLTVEKDFVCYGETVKFFVNTNGTPIWSTGETGVKEIEVTITENTTISVKVENECIGGFLIQEKTVEVILPYAYAGEDVMICPGQEYTLTANEGLSYDWDPTGESTRSIVVSPEEDTEYSVIVEDICNNFATAFVFIDVKTDVIANAGEDMTICQGQVATLFGSGADTLAWLQNGVEITSESSIDVSPDEDLTLILRVRDICVDDDTVTVFVNPTPNIALEDEVIEGCTPLDVSIRNLTDTDFNGDLNYEWTLDGEAFSTDSDFTKTFTGEGTHDLKLKVVSDLGCGDTLVMPAKLNAYGHPISGIQHDYALEDFILHKGPFNFYAMNSAPDWVYEWIFTGTTTSANVSGEEIEYEFEEDGDFELSLTVTNIHGCDSTFKIQFNVEKLNSMVAIPTAFTPNGDNLNDEFKIYADTKALQEFQCNIFNRWGQLVFSTEDVDNSWDGKKANGEYVDSGAFVVKVKYTTIEGVEGEEVKLFFLLK